jgi:DNA invertase Pin-like site-specific DNA recombinase
MIQERVRAGLKRAVSAGQKLGRPPITPELEKRIHDVLKAPGRTEGVRRIAARFGVAVGTVQRISRPFVAASVAPYDEIATITLCRRLRDPSKFSCLHEK